MTGYVYHLVCPIRKEPVYVGSTKMDIYTRLAGHIFLIKRSNYPLYKYFRDNSVIPTIVIIEKVEIVSKTTLFDREKHWILQYLKSGLSLFNVYYTPRKETDIIPMPQIEYDADRLSAMVKEKRGHMGLRVTAKDIGISASTLCRVENKKEPDITSMANICSWLDIQMEYFFKSK